MGATGFTVPFLALTYVAHQFWSLVFRYETICGFAGIPPHFCRCRPVYHLLLCGRLRVLTWLAICCLYRSLRLFFLLVSGVEPPCQLPLFFVSRLRQWRFCAIVLLIHYMVRCYIMCGCYTSSKQAMRQSRTGMRPVGVGRYTLLRQHAFVILSEHSCDNRSSMFSVSF